MAKTDNLTDFLTDLANGIRLIETGNEHGDDIDPQDFRSHIVKQGSCTISGGDLSGGDAVSPTVSLSSGNDTTMSNIAIGQKDATNYPYYFKVNSSSSSGSSTVSRAAVTDTHIAGYIPDQPTTEVIEADSKTVTVNAGSGSTYVNIKAATLGASGGATAYFETEPGAISISNITSAISGKTQITTAPSTDTADISKYYVAVNATAAESSASGDIGGIASAWVSSAGYAGGPVTGSGSISGTATVDILETTSDTYYIPIESGSCTVSGGELTPGEGSVSASGTNVTLSEVATPPTSGHYITVKGSGSVSRAAVTSKCTAGYISDKPATTIITSTAESSSIATKYYVLEGIDDTIYLYGKYIMNDILNDGGLSDAVFPITLSINFGFESCTTPGTLNSSYVGMLIENDSTAGYHRLYYKRSDGGLDLAYSSSTYGGVTTYTGWQAIDGVSTNSKYIVFESPQTTSGFSDFYKWFSANILSHESWGSSSSSDSEAENSPLPIEVATEEEMTALLESGEVGGVYKYTGETGTYENGALYALIALSDGKAWRKLSVETVEPYLTFSSPNSFTLNVVDNTKYWDGILEYSTDLNTWSEWDGTTTLSADSGKLYMRGTGNTLITGYGGTAKRYWVLEGSEISCIGNIENLLDYATVANGEHPTMSGDCYCHMFRDCTSLIAAPELPATTLTSYCYESMFYGCTSLVTAPALPATTLVEGCYMSMFYRCTSLTTAPALPATTLANYCYDRMFWGCTSLTTIPELPATALADYCYRSMFNSCINLKLSTVQEGKFQTPYRIPTSGEGTTAVNALSSMFGGTGGTFTGTPEINTTYYLDTRNTVGETLSITENGTYDVVDFVRAKVNVPIPEGYIKPEGTVTITANGTHDVTAYASAEVNVEPALQEKTITENGEVVPDEGFDGLSKVTVDVQVEKYDGSVKDVISTTLKSSDNFVIIDSAGQAIVMLGG